MKSILITSTDLMMIQFLVPHVLFLAEKGYEIDIACSDVGGRMDEVREKLRDAVNDIHIVRLHRSPADPENLKGFRDMRKVIDSKRFDIIWTNEPVMGVATRIAAKKARKGGSKVLYMAHGFHFYKGAPLLNWMIYYPIEKAASRLCDEIVTINSEDRRLAEKKMHSPKVGFIHGIGVNAERFHPLSDEEIAAVRADEGLSADDYVVICVGELNDNKNQKTLIKAAAFIKKDIPRLKVLLAGKGEKEAELREQIRELGLTDTVRLLGYRRDLPRLLPATDLVVSCSLREGLPVNIIEAMLCGKPVVASRNRGHVDLVEEMETGHLVEPINAVELGSAIKQLAASSEIRRYMGERGMHKAQKYSVEFVRSELLQVIEGLISKECR